MGSTRPRFRLAVIAAAHGVSPEALRAVVRTKARRSGSTSIVVVSGHTFFKFRNDWWGQVPDLMLSDGRLRQCVSVREAAARLGKRESALRAGLVRQSKRDRSGFVVARWSALVAFKFSDSWRVVNDETGADCG